MAGRSDIEAGKAYVTTYVKNSALFKGLALVRKRISGFASDVASRLKVIGSSMKELGGNIQNVGGVITRMGAGLLAPFIASVLSLEEAKQPLADIKKALGEALGKPLLPVLNQIRDIVLQFAGWAKQNQSIVVLVAKIAAGVAVVGVVLSTVGALVTAVGATFGAAATMVALLGTLLGALLTPAGLLIAIVVAGAVAWARFTKSGQNAISSLMAILNPILTTVQTIVGGIADAFLAGDLELAGAIAMKGLEVVFREGLATVAGLIGGTLGDTLKSIGSDLIDGDFSKAWQTATEGIGVLWDALMSAVLTSFAEVANKVRNIWNGLTAGISVALTGIQAALVEYGGPAGKLAAKGLAGAQKGLGVALAPIDDALAIGTSAAASAAAAAQAQSAKSSGEFSSRVGAGANEADAQLAQQRRELDELRRQAAEARAKANAAGPTGRPDIAAPDVGELKSSVASTFSSAALMAMGRGGGVQDRVLKVNEQQLVALGVVAETAKGLLAESKRAGKMRP